MHIKELGISAVRSYEKMKIEFSPGINIIAGANNSGKSTILRCIQKLQNINSCITAEDIRRGYNHASIHVGFQLKENAEKSHFKTSKNKTQYDDTVIDILFEIDKENTISELAFSTQNEISFNDDELRYQFDSEKGKFDFEGLPNMEDENNYIYTFLSKRKTQHYSSQGGRMAAFSVDEDFRNLPSKVQNLSNGSHPFHKEYVKHCNDILGFNIGKVPGNDNSSQDKLGIFVSSGEMIYLESMGEGVVNIIGLLAILLTENNKLFLIEELENDIHPESLKKLLAIILEKSKNNQFIISTHSNIVLKYLASAENSKIFYTTSKINDYIYKLTKAKISLPSSTIVEIENTPEKRLKILEKLGYDLFDFDLYSSYIIFEESSAEQIVKEFLIPTYVPEIINKVKTIAAGGASNLEARFNDFLRLFVYIHANPVYNNMAWVIADGDEAGISNMKKLKEKFTTWDSSHFINFSKSNFEEYYPEPFKSKYFSIREIKNKEERRKAKISLTQEVLHYIRNNRAEAKSLFKVSAKEVISILKKCAKKLI